MPDLHRAVQEQHRRGPTLLVDERVVREIAPGRYTLRLDNTLVKKTFEFDAAPGERVEYRFANTAGRFAIPFLALMGVAPLFLTVERVKH